MSIGSMSTTNPDAVRDQLEPQQRKVFGGKLARRESPPFDAKANDVLTIWLICLAVAPLVVAVAWPATFGLYALIAIVAGLTLIVQRKRPLGRFPRLLLGQLLFLGVLSFWHSSDTSTFVNIGSIAFGTAALGLMVLMWPANEISLRIVLRKLRILCLFVILAGICLGPVFSSLFGMANPISNILSGQRLVIFSIDAGHSVAIECSVIIFMISTSNILNESNFRRLAYGAFSFIVIVLAKSSLAYVCLAGLIYVFLVEIWRIPSGFRNVIHICAAVLMTVSLFSNFDSLLLFSRTLQMGSGASRIYKSYGLTAGRQQLNDLLIRASKKRPIMGSGVKDNSIVFGAYSNGIREARTESGLRMAVKFGWPYFFYMILICLSPLSVIFSKNRPLRIIGISLSVYCIVTVSLNNLFEIAQMWNTMCMLPLVVFVSSCGVAGRKYMIFSEIRPGGRSANRAKRKLRPI